MNSDLQRFEHALPAAPAGMPWGPVLSLAPAADLYANIGYESADPSLQAPLWRAAMQEQPNRED